jgi:hypothetical protein
VRNGSRCAIVNGDKEYELVGELWQFGQFAGQWMTLTGVLDSETINVSSARLATAKAIRGNNIKREAMSRSIFAEQERYRGRAGNLPYLTLDSHAPIDRATGIC